MREMYGTAMVNRGGRDGEVEVPNGSIHMKIDHSGVHSEGTNPEQLSAARYASCFNGAVQCMLEENDLESDSEIKVRVSLFQPEGGGYQIGVVLEVSLSGLEKNRAEKIVEEARAFCPHSKAAKGSIDVEVTTVEQEIFNATINEITKDLIKGR